MFCRSLQAKWYPMNAEENKALARRFPEDVVTKGNIDLLDELLTEDFVDHFLFGQKVHGIPDTKKQAQMLRNGFPDITATVEDAVAEDDRVALRVTATGTHDGPFMGLEPTGESFTIQNMAFFRIENGRVAERWVQPDIMDLFQQLGVIDVPIGERSL